MPTNSLIHEKSPYLLQHAHNPVNWHAWGEEAFRRAREEDKPIFLSIGYSTCHWCHVMERESFENQDIAEVLNRNFVPIKVDREERPDVDRIYMLFVQATTGSGGWPMSVFLTPDLRPFFGGTYFPPERRWNHPGFGEVLERVAEAWRLDRGRIVESSRDVLAELQRHSDVVPSAAILDPAVLESAFYAFRRSFDTRHGGFGGAPKFPRPAVHNFLLRYYWRTRNLEAMEMVFATLNKMAHGGMHDHLGGGFHRYSVDERWFLPHFEKMLYDQAQLVVSYLEGWQISNDAYYADVARVTLNYVRREMTSPEGGFYSAEDADSVIDPAHPEVKGEGAYYVWSKAEIEEALGRPACDWFWYQYGVEEQGNVANDPHGEFAGKNILFEAHALEETAKQFGRPVEEVRNSLAESRSKLLARRGGRVRPHLDDKILTSWNGLMISAFAKGAQALGDAEYEQAARRAADFVLGTMYRPEDRSLLRRYREGDAAIAGFLDDYALFVQGLIDLYETVFEIRYLQAAIDLTDAMLGRFEDREHGGFFSTAGGENDLVLRIKDDYDGAEPSGNSIAALNLLRLAQFTGRDDYREAAERTLRAVASRIASAPEAVPQMLAAVEFSLATPKQIVLAGERDAEDTRALLRAVNRRFVPHKVVILLDEGSRDFFTGRLASARGLERRGGRATAYVCENYACRLPVNDPAALDQQLAPVKQVQA